jgi:LPXTG-site transpeptidase (sortase) family protein
LVLSRWPCPPGLLSRSVRPSNRILKAYRKYAEVLRIQTPSIKALAAVAIMAGISISVIAYSSTRTLTADQEAEVARQPIRLTIPKIGVDAAIVPIGLTPDGAMGVPENPADVAWYAPGPYPGESGNAVIAGHYGWKDGGPAAFDDLHDLIAGDRIFVEDAEGITLTFVVRDIQIYDPNQDATEVFGMGDGNAHLNLITCQGVWNEEKESYSKRLIVFTDRE